MPTQFRGVTGRIERLSARLVCERVRELAHGRLAGLWRLTITATVEEAVQHAKRAG